MLGCTALYGYWNTLHTIAIAYYIGIQYISVLHISNISPRSSTNNHHSPLWTTIQSAKINPCWSTSVNLHNPHSSTNLQEKSQGTSMNDGSRHCHGYLSCKSMGFLWFPMDFSMNSISWAPQPPLRAGATSTPGCVGHASFWSRSTRTRSSSGWIVELVTNQLIIIQWSTIVTSFT